MALWFYNLDVSDIFYNDAFTAVAKAHAISARIRLSDWYEQNQPLVGNPLEALCDELEMCVTADDFDCVWDAIYDLADDQRCWINTVADYQAEAPTLVTRDHE